MALAQLVHHSLRLPLLQLYNLKISGFILLQILCMNWDFYQFLYDGSYIFINAYLHKVGQHCGKLKEYATNHTRALDISKEIQSMRNLWNYFQGEKWMRITSYIFRIPRLALGLIMAHPISVKDRGVFSECISLFKASPSFSQKTKREEKIQRR